jgi:hypothetical protein
VLLGLVASTALIRGVGGRDRRWVLGFAVTLGLLLYTHAWAVFFAAGALVAACLLGARPRDLAWGFGPPALAFGPWLPTFLFQAGHTGAPWADPPSAVVLVEVVGLGAAGVLASRLGRSEPERRALLALGALPAVAVGLAWLGTWAEPMWAGRYLAIVVGPLLLLAAPVLARVRPAGTAALAGLALAWALFSPPAPKSNVASAAASVEQRLRHGDTVLATQPELLPVLAHYLPPGLGWASALGRVDDPRVMDWRDALVRLEGARPGPAARRLVGELPRGSRLLFVRPDVSDPRRWRAPWTALVARRSIQWAAALDADPRLRPVGALPPPRRPTSRTSVTGVLYQRRG